MSKFSLGNFLLGEVALAVCLLVAESLELFGDGNFWGYVVTWLVTTAILGFLYYEGEDR